jgi:sec-independent protein translocase protein TatC
MADPADEIRPEEEEEGGGPVKTFLEHLEDLRWVLIKSGTALVVAMMVCLLGVNHVVAILTWPLDRARKLGVVRKQTVEVKVGTNLVFSFQPKTNFFGDLNLGSNPYVVLDLAPVQAGTNQVLALQVRNDPTDSTPRRKGPELVFLDPAAPFITSLHLAFFGGILLAAPFIFYYVGQFVLPALKFKEKKYGLRAFGVGLGLFLVGVCFCYFGIMPLALRAAENYSHWMGMATYEWRAEAYFSFVTKFMLGMGLGFELPVVLLALVKIGILDYKKLASFRRYMIIVNLILGALLTTPEVFTQLLMFVPLQLLYEATIWIAWYWERQEKKREATAEARQPEERRLKSQDVKAPAKDSQQNDSP